jgi:hypothetical protein
MARFNARPIKTWKLFPLASSTKYWRPEISKFIVRVRATGPVHARLLTAEHFANLEVDGTRGQPASPWLDAELVDCQLVKNEDPASKAQAAGVLSWELIGDIGPQNTVPEIPPVSPLAGSDASGKRES